MPGTPGTQGENGPFGEEPWTHHVAGEYFGSYPNDLGNTKG